MYRYVLFDLDGTLTDSREGICKSVQYALVKVGRPAPELKELECFIGPPLKTSFREFYNIVGEEADRAVAFYRERYSDVGKYENMPYEGIADMLQAVRDAGYILAVASSKPELYVEDILKHFDLYDYFHHVVGSDMEGKRGEKEDVIEEVFRRMDLDEAKRKELAIMVGDRHFDINGAKHFGLDSVGVTYGFAKDNELTEAGATYVVDTVKELQELLLRKKAD
ncbi:MAG: HAD hydrolase-like protein [Lachnospiraceae bacterium]|nr:HAD hydrolase-like protein [Lachnospiraceae bacterium]